MTKGLQCIIGRAQTRPVIWMFSDVRINTAKQKDGLTSFLMLSILEGKIFQYGFLDEHKLCVNNLIDPQHREIMVTKPEFFVA